MNPKAIKKARLLLPDAEASYAAMVEWNIWTFSLIPPSEQTPDTGEDEIVFVNFHGFWAKFLLTASLIYNKLGAGAKGNSGSVAWWGRTKHERNKDELLRYIHHARNSEEHGLDEITFLRDTPPTSTHPDVRVVDGGLVLPAGLPIGTVIAQLHGPTVHLLPVVNRGVKYPVPTSHRGSALIDQSPMNVARLALDYLKWLIDDAERYVA